MLALPDLPQSPQANPDTSQRMTGVMKRLRNLGAEPRRLGAAARDKIQAARSKIRKPSAALAELAKLPPDEVGSSELVDTGADTDGATTSAAGSNKADSDRDQAIEAALQEKLVQERGRLTQMFPAAAEIEYSQETGRWHIQATLESGYLDGGQQINCYCRSAGPYSMAGAVGGFRVSNLMINNELIFEATSENPVNMTIVHIEEESAERADGSEWNVPRHAYDARAGEFYMFGLKTTDDAVAVLHENEHGQLGDLTERLDLNDNYKLFIKMVQDKGFACDELEEEGAVERGDYTELLTQSRFMITTPVESDTVIAVLREESRANRELLNRWLSKAPTLFPSDPSLEKVTALLKRNLGTYIEAAEFIGFDTSANNTLIYEVLAFDKPAANDSADQPIEPPPDEISPAETPK